MPLPRILLIGDSIRMSYQPHVKAMLEGRAEVVGPTENCKFALYTAWRMPGWIEELGVPDIVHSNNGLWDCAFMSSRGPRQFSIPDYARNIQTVWDNYEFFKIPQIIWATSTPIDQAKRPFDENGWASWRASDVPLYNAAGREVMEAKGVPINDLYSFMLPHLSEWTVGDGVHLSETGQKAIAAAVVAKLQPAIAKFNTKG